MIYFLHGQDSYRSKEKLLDIIEGYKKVHKSGLNLIYIDATEKSFADFYSNFKVVSMFAEKKLIILKNVFSDSKFQEEFLENIKDIEKFQDIVVVYENSAADKRIKFFKALAKQATCQEFELLDPALFKKWVIKKFEAKGIKINLDALDMIISFVGNNLWQMSNEVEKLSNYKGKTIIKKEDILTLIKPNIENDIFKTIDELAKKNKKQALSLLHKHLDNGDNVLYLLSMIAYQFRNLLIIKELQDAQIPYQMIAKKSGLHPFVVQKTSSLCSQFSNEQLKKIYQKIFLIDLNIKTGKVEPETALDLLVAEI
jgi:DNA polymerase-3 subunit delta